MAVQTVCAKLSSPSSCCLSQRVALPSIWSPWSMCCCYPWITHPQTWPSHLWCSQIDFLSSFLWVPWISIHPYPSPTSFVLLITPSLSQLVSSSIFLKPTVNLVTSLLKTYYIQLFFVYTFALSDFVLLLQVQSRFSLWVMIPLVIWFLLTPLASLFAIPWCPSSQASL